MLQGLATPPMLRCPRSPLPLPPGEGVPCTSMSLAACELTARVRHPSDSGFADEATQAAKLMAVFRHFNAAKDGFISFAEFQAALVRLNFVGVQREVRLGRHVTVGTHC